MHLYTIEMAEMMRHDRARHKLVKMAEMMRHNKVRHKLMKKVAELKAAD